MFSTVQFFFWAWGRYFWDEKKNKMFLASHAGGPPCRGVPTAPGSFFQKKERKKREGEERKKEKTTVYDCCLKCEIPLFKNIVKKWSSVKKMHENALYANMNTKSDFFALQHNACRPSLRFIKEGCSTFQTLNVLRFFLWNLKQESHPLPAPGRTPSACAASRGPCDRRPPRVAAAWASSPVTRL